MSDRPVFDPYGLLETLDRHHVAYIVIGGFARVIQGTDEITRGLDIVPSTRSENLRRLSDALADLGAPDVEPPTAEPLALSTPRGDLRIVPVPAGTRGYDDLRRAANREPLGRGVRPSVASPGDLARMLASLGREEDTEKLHQLRRLIELERVRSRGRSIER
jgi:hypothetical protein